MRLRNLALRQPATQSSVSRWSNGETPEDDAKGANNGIINRGQGFHTAWQLYPWWQVDLGDVCRLAQVNVYNRLYCADRLSRLSVLGSLDGERWLELHRKSDDSVFGAADRAPYVAALPQDCAARYVRIQCNTTDFMHFNECQVFGANVDAAEAARLESIFEERLAAQLRKLCGPVETADLADIDGELAISNLMFPFPPTEVWRTKEREWILDYPEPGGVGAEIGVFRGHFSEAILRKLSPQKFYFVDPWRKLGESFYFKGSYANDNQLPTALARRETELRLRKFPQTETVIIEDFFPDCADQIREPLDWIYVDARHEYEPALNDITASAKLIRPGGLILGDDFWPGRGSAPPVHGVARAVHTFFAGGGFELMAAGPQGQWCLRRRPV